MVNSLYWVSSLTYAIALLCMLISDIHINRKPEKEEKAFRKLVVWVLYFCLQDTLWGFCAGPFVKSDAALTAASTLFHLSTVATTYFWLDYILVFLGEKIKHPRAFRILDLIIIGFQATMLVINLFKPLIFYVQDGLYITAFLRPFAFLNQYLVYLTIGIMMAVFALRAKGETRSRYISVLMFALAPILSGAFQLMYPDGPFYSIGYFLGCVIIHLFIVLNMRDELKQLHFEKENEINLRMIAEQKILSNTDRLTGLHNRRAYEDDLLNYPKISTKADFVYISMDVNGLKLVNDTLGHSAGDELLVGASECMQQCLGAYGSVYRVGGDEFAAIIFADETKLVHIRQDLIQIAQEWRGKAVDSLSISTGYAAKWEFPDMTVEEIAKIADTRMYQDKAAYYSRIGVDRRGQQTAYAALCGSYAKILKINLTTDSYAIITMDTKEQTGDKGFGKHISTWLHDFGTSGQVHPADLNAYLQKTDISNLRAHFLEGRQYFSVFYRRRMGNVYRKVLMEMLPAEDYRQDHQSLYLYVKDIDSITVE